MGSYSSASEIHHYVRYFTDKHLDPTTMWNIINSINSIRTYINTTISLFHTCLLIHHFCIFIRSLRSLSKLIRSGSSKHITRLVGITLAGLITCSAIFFPVAPLLLPNIVSNCVLVTTWRHFKGNCCMKSDHIDGHSSLAQSRIIPYMLCPILSLSSCIYILQSDSMVLLGYNFVQWN